MYKKLISDLNEYNRWRRGDDDSLPAPDPKAIGVMIDGAVTAIESLQAELAKYRDAPVVGMIGSNGFPFHPSHFPSSEERRLYGPFKPLIVKPGETNDLLP